VKVIEPYVVIEDCIDGDQIIRNIERYGRVCYKSESAITDSSSKEFIRKILDNGHESVLEHEKVTVRVICDRGVSHEIVRHRIASYSQESTRYCNYSKSKYGSEITCIKPLFYESDDTKFAMWHDAMCYCEKVYMDLLKSGSSPQEARSVLPNSLKTEIIVTMNLREWRHFFRLRTQTFAHPQMQQIAKLIFNELNQRIPVVFDDIRIS
jgi:thymidylate synthase (FAD)